MFQVFGLDVGILLLCELQSLLCGFSHYEVLLALVVEVVGWYAMTPPQLTADTPVFDILQPVAIGVLIFLGVELYVVVHDRCEGDVGKVLHLEEPLCRELRLDGHIGAL